MTLGERLRALRQKHFMSMADVRDKTQISTATLSFIETDRHEPSIDVLIRISDLYEMPFRDLFIDVDKFDTFKRPYWKSPRGYMQLIDDPEYKDDMDEDWKELLLNVHYRGCRCRTKRDWIELHLHLHRLFRGRK